MFNTNTNIHKTGNIRIPGLELCKPKMMSQHLLYLTDCPFEYCYNSEQDLEFFYSANNEIFLKQNPHSTSYFPICNNGQTGTLCGKCVNGSTLVFGSNKCTYCDSKLNYWLFISLIAFIGPLLVFMLFALKLTLTGGTLTGVIFYVNIIASGLLTYLLSKDTNREPVQIFHSNGYYSFHNSDKP